MPTHWHKAQKCFQGFLWVWLTVCLPAHPSPKPNASVLLDKQSQEQKKAETVGGWVWTVAKLDMTAFFRALKFQDIAALRVYCMFVCGVDVEKE